MRAESGGSRVKSRGAMMDSPSHAFRVVDEANRVTYVVRSYRALSDAEARDAVRLFLQSTANRNRPKRNVEVEIVTLIGWRD